MKVSFEGIGEIAASFYNDGASVGEMCKMTANGTVGACASGDGFIGVAVDCDGQYASIVTSGFVTVSYTGAAPVAGFAKLSADGNGGVKADSAGAQYAVVSVDTNAGTATIII